MFPDLTKFAADAQAFVKTLADALDRNTAALNANTAARLGGDPEAYPFDADQPALPLEGPRNAPRGLSDEC